jgi:hypothetical protein
VPDNTYKTGCRDAAEKEIEMKVYNIEDTNRFFEVLSECKGDVEVVGRDGSTISMNDKDVVRFLETAYTGMMIPEMELRLSSPADRQRVLSFMANTKAAA